MMFSLDMLDCPVYSLSLSTLNFYAGWIEGIILSQFNSLGFCVEPLLHAQKLPGGWVVVVVVAHRILVSAQALSPCH